jgi:hypothetical protein
VAKAARGRLVRLLGDAGQAKGSAKRKAMSPDSMRYPDLWSYFVTVRWAPARTVLVGPLESGILVLERADLTRWC